MQPAVTTPKSIENVRLELTAQRKAILAHPAEKALEMILEASTPAALVHSFPAADLYYLIHEIGPDDALPLIGLASQSQLEFLLDQETWDRDRIDLKSLTLWLERFVQADPERLLRWMGTEKLDLIEFYLSRTLDVKFREHDADPSDFGSDFFTLDNVLYVRILDHPAPDAAEPDFQARHRDLVRQILDTLAANDYVRYQNLLFGAAYALPSVGEEKAYRWRNVRLAEKGFIPFEEAIGIYQPTRPERLHQEIARRRPLAESPDTQLPMVPLQLIPTDHLFSLALQAIPPGEAVEYLQLEFATLCNRVAVADRKRIDGREALGAVVRKVCGYVAMGIEKVARPGEATSTDEISASEAGGTVRTITLEGLFRLGYSEAVRLKNAAERWVAASWFARQGLPLTFWGETWLGVLGGLLLKRPLCFDNYRSGTLYRDFAALNDIRQCEHHLSQIVGFDRLLDAMAIKLAPRPRIGLLTYKNLLLTLWARHRLGLANEVQPIPLKTFAPFFEALFGPPVASAAPKIPHDLRRVFLEWLAQSSQRSPAALSDEIGGGLENLFCELEEEYARLARPSLDPRYIPHFLLCRDSA